MTVRQELANALSLTERAIAALESGHDEAEWRVAEALAACEGVASLPFAQVAGPEEAAAVRALAAQASRLHGALEAASRRLAAELERLQALRRAAVYGATASAHGEAREA